MSNETSGNGASAGGRSDTNSMIDAGKWLLTLTEATKVMPGVTGRRVICIGPRMREGFALFRPTSDSHETRIRLKAHPCRQVRMYA